MLIRIISRGLKILCLLAAFALFYQFSGTKADAALLFSNEGTTSGWDYSYSPGKSYNIQQISNPTRSGNTAIRYEIRKSEPDPGGKYHSGLRKESMGKRGQTRWFGVSSYAVLESDHESGFTINQWFNKGSDCPVAMLTAQPFNNDFIYKILYGPNKANSTAVDLSLSTPVPDRQWVDFVVKTVFKSDTTGSVEVWVNGVKKLTYNGPTCLANDNALNFHSEVYSFFQAASPADAKRIVVQDSIRIGDENSSFSEVNPGGTTPTVLFTDDFEDGNSTGWTTSGGSWSVVTDGTKMFKQANASYTAVASAGSGSWSNYTYEAKVKPLSFGSTASVGLCARYTDLQNNYSFIYSTAGELRIVKKVGGVNTVLAQKAYTLTPGNTYTFKAVLNGSTLDFYINGVKQLSATDSTYTTGKVALMTYYTSAEFDDILVQ